MDNILYWTAVGVIAACLGTMAMPSKFPGGIFSDFLVGILGALFGGLLFLLLTGIGFGMWIGGIGVSFVGAVIMLVIIRVVSGETVQRKINKA